jgi:hypothetical protein
VNKILLRELSRRRFLERVGLVAAGSLLDPRGVAGEHSTQISTHSDSAKQYGSGHFGEWISDVFNLPAFRYTCDQTTDPKAATLTDASFRAPTDHTHQVGNDRVIAAVSNYGYVQVRQDEGSPKFLNDYSPERGQFGGGIGYLTDGTNVLSTYLPAPSGYTFERVFGVGYVQKKVSGAGYTIDHVIFAPFGDDPVLISQATITNNGGSAAELRWIEYWGCQMYQFSYRSWLQAATAAAPGCAAELRRRFGDRFANRFRKTDDNCGLVESKQFLGRSAEDGELWQEVKNVVAASAGISFALVPGQDDSMEDLAPPATFLVSLDRPSHRFATNGKAFFGSGGVIRPTGMARELDGDLNSYGPESAMLLELGINLGPGESQTVHFLYGYLPKGTDLTSLTNKYRSTKRTAWTVSSEKWNHSGLRFATGTAPYVERELIWSHYYLRSNLTYDDYFNEHILSQGQIYQYTMGLQGAARDPLQHALPFLFSDPNIVKEILRYTLKEVRDDGSIPYSIVGHGLPMPTAQDDASDLQLWLIWVACEYVLATRDFAFLNEELEVPLGQYPTTRNVSVRVLLVRCYRYIVEDIGVGPHGLMRMLFDDWLDGLVFQAIPPGLRSEYIKVGESVLNSAMASYVFERFASVLDHVAESPEMVADARRKAEQHRQAVRAQWNGKWFRRAWLGPHLGWIGDDSLWIEPQSWAILGGAATPEQSRTVTSKMDELLRRPSPIGAMRWSPRIQTPNPPRPPGARPRVCASLNGILIWALAKMDGAMAWDEWKKNTLAAHADAYPDLWYGTWSGPDAYNGVLQARPGQVDPSESALKVGKDNFGSLDYPVMNMHTHAWPLYSTVKLIGLEFTVSGLTLRPSLPLDEYKFASDLFGFIKSARGYEGWYFPSGMSGGWTITIYLPQAEAAKLTRQQVNGSEKPLSRAADGSIEIRGESAPTVPLRWSITA